MQFLATSIFMRELRTQARTARGVAVRLAALSDEIRSIELRQEPARAMDDDGEALYLDLLEHRDDDEDVADQCFITAQSILTAAALASKCLWSPRTSSVSGGRGERLRELLSVTDDDFPVLRSRRVRNAFEHFDERIEDHLMSSNVVLDRYVGSSDWTGPIDVMRSFNVTTWEVKVAGNSVDLRALLHELDDLSQRATSWLNNAHASDRPSKP